MRATPEQAADSARADEVAASAELEPSVPARPPAKEAASNGAIAGLPTDGRRETQRAALRDLVALATECAATESRIEREHAAALEEATKTSQQAEWALRQRFETQRQAVREQYQQAVAQVQAHFKAQIAALEAADEPARQKVEIELEAVGRTVTKKIEHATWLADSALEIALNQLREQEKQLTNEVGEHAQALNQMRDDARERAARYGYTAEPPKPKKRPTDDDADANVDPEPEPGHGYVDLDAELAKTTTPTDADAAYDPSLTPEQSGTQFQARREHADAQFNALRSLTLPNLVVGSTPYLIAGLGVALAAGAAWLATGLNTPNLMAVAFTAGATAVVAVVLIVVLRSVARRQAREALDTLEKTLIEARQAGKAYLRAAARVRDEEAARARHKRESEVRAATNHFAPATANAQRKREKATATLDAAFGENRARVEHERDVQLAEAEARQRVGLSELKHREERDAILAREHAERQLRLAHERYQQAKHALERRLLEGLASIRAPIGADGSAGKPLAWNDPAWDRWIPSKTFAAEARFGELEVDLQKIANSVPKTDDANVPRPIGPDGELMTPREGDGAADAANTEQTRLALPAPFAMPATLAFPRHASLLVQADREGRAAAIRTLQMVMARLLTTLPPGRVRFTLIDPIGLGQNFAGFMHLADHDEALVGGRIWTEQDHIEQRLTHLTGHMETVIQKYLRNEFETIDEFNAQAGELAEPYRFLVICDFPSGFTGEALRRLSSIAGTGARCGVYTLIFRDVRQPLPHGTHVEDLEHHAVNLVQESLVRPGGAIDKFVWKDPVLEQFPLTVDAPPDEQRLTKITDIVGRGAKEANRVEVAFETIAPSAQQMWTGDSTRDLTVPIGRLGATRLQYMRLGRGVAQHVLIGGKTGSGKSTLLHALVTNLAMWYSPQQVEFYLVDFKKGVEFKTYATHHLPHARAIAVESDREFGLSVLQRLDAELSRRGDLFRRAGAQDLAGYRATPGAQPVPRTLLIVDEFQEFFSEDDKIGQDASVLLDRLVRQGRAFGVHVLLGSQTIAGASGLGRSTIGQMAVRVALQTSEADSQLILGDNNYAAKLLSRPGEAIYNDQGGLVEGNSPFQIAWLPDEQREVFLDRVRKKADASGAPHAGMDAVVFEGNAPADIHANKRLAELLAQPMWGAAAAVPKAFLGEPVAIKDPTAIAFRRQSGSNVLVVGQQEEAAMAMMMTSIVSLAAQHPPGAAQFYVLDATPVDSSLAGRFEQLKGMVPHELRLIEYRAAGEAVGELARELQARRDAEHPNAAAIYVFVYGLQRYRSLRKAEEDFSFSSSDDKPADPGKQFADLLREGPAMGIHIIAWADTPAAVERTLDRGSLREFDHRVLFQMSASDSSNLIDSPAANKLGFHRALAYSEEQGVMEKFRPYALPSVEWLGQVKDALGRKT